MLTIACTCITMAFDSPLESGDPFRASAIATSELAYLVIFTTELVLRVVAYGLGEYLGDGWCRLDLVTVALSWAFQLVPGFGAYSAIRAVRGLRPLRALKRVPGMPALVQAIFVSLPKVGTVLVLCAFIVLLFALVGVQLFQGVLHYRCASRGGIELADDGLGTCSPVDRRWAWLSLAGTAGDDDGAAAATRVSGCPAQSACTFFDANPASGLFSFDSVADAIMPVLLTLTFDDWSALMYSVVGAVDASWPSLFFVLLVSLGGFFVVNLFLAVVFEQFIWIQSTEVRAHLHPLLSRARSHL